MVCVIQTNLSNYKTDSFLQSETDQREARGSREREGIDYKFQIQKANSSIPIPIHRSNNILAILQREREREREAAAEEINLEGLFFPFILGRGKYPQQKKFYTRDLPRTCKKTHLNPADRGGAGSPGFCTPLISFNMTKPPFT
jgi:hypothetical protein